MQLISQTEFIDLERLQSDRNRCAHPSLTLEGGIFNPPAELARVHLRSAVEHLLQYPPAQGKYALSRILGELESDYFPTTKDEVLVVFKQSPLQNARESLVRNLVISIVKDLLFSVNDGHDKEKKVATLEAVNTMYPDIFVQTLNEKLSDVFRQLNDDVLYRVLPLLGNVPESWSSLGEDVRQKLDSYLGELPAEHVDEAIPLLDIQGLQEALECRLHRFSVQDFRDSFIMEMPAVLQDRLVDLYENSRSFEEANILSRDIAMQAKRFDEQRVERIVRACGENGQCAGSFEMPKVLVKLRENSSVSDEKIDRWLLEVGLREQVRKSDPLN